jgi:long-chain acyl-CoA synthetase
MQLELFLEHSAARFPDKTALVCQGRRWTYAELNARANRLANWLLDQGLERGDRVALQLENSVEAVISIFGILKAGGVFSPLHPSMKADKLTYVLNNCRAAGVILPARRQGVLDQLGTECPHLRFAVVVGDEDIAAATVPTTRWDDIQQHSPDAQPAKRCINIDLAALIYTSGSTGQPKGVMLTHLNMTSAATSITTYLENSADDVVINVLPLSFDYGLYQVLMTFQFGGTLVLESSFAFPHQVLETIVRERVTGLPLVPTISAVLLQRDLSKYDFSELRYMTNTAAALPTEHIQQIRRLLPHVKLFSMYGLTECKRVSYLPPEEIDRRPTSVGRGMPNEEVYLVDETGGRLPNGSTGELVIRGANVMKGYWEAPEESARRLKPGPLPGEFVLHSGDLFRTDDEGYLYFLARMDDVIKSRGEKVSPREVENVLFAHPAVSEAVVFGVPDAVLGQKIKAVVTLKADAKATPAQLQRHCAAHLEDYLVPQVIEVVADLPRTPTGKIDKKPLMALAH